MARSLPKVCPFLVTVDLKLKWPELPVARITPPYLTCRTVSFQTVWELERGKINGETPYHEYFFAI